jgi:hypothetical protein
MQQKTLSRHIGGALLLLALAYFLGTSQVNSAASRTQQPAVRPAASPIPGHASPTITMRSNSGTARPDSLSDMIMTGTLVLLTATLCISFLLAQRRREQKRSRMPETDPALIRVPTINDKNPSTELSTDELLITNIPPQDTAWRVERLKNRLRAM